MSKLATSSELDDLIERLERDAVMHKQQGWDGDAEWDLRLAAALREQAQEIARLTKDAETRDKFLWAAQDAQRRAEAERNLAHARADTHLADAHSMRKQRDALRNWIDNNMTHYNTAEAGARPILAEFGKRVWYHVTDDCDSFPFSAAIDAAMKPREVTPQEHDVLNKALRQSTREVKPCACIRPEIHGHQLLCKQGKAR